MLKIKVEGHEDLEALARNRKDDIKLEKLNRIYKLEAQMTTVSFQFTEEWGSYSSFAPEHN